MFLRNAWYVAAWDTEVTRQLTSVTVLGERVVLFRATTGAPVALADACLHRRLPLSMGRLNGDEVVCGYHGLVFDTAGKCVRVPGADRVPGRLCVRHYPTVSRHGLVWIWMGDPAMASEDLIFPVEHASDPAWGRNRGDSMTIDCNYLLITDNLLDPSHVAWVHLGSFGTSDCEETPSDTSATANGVVVTRSMNDVPVAPFYVPYVSFIGHCHRLQHYEVRYPCHAIVKSIFSPAGTTDIEGTHPQAMVMHSYNFLTPIDESRTRYFWFQTRNFLPRDEGISMSMDEQIRAVFAEDKVILEAVQRGLAEQPDATMNLAIDRGPLSFRKTLKEMIAAEHQASSNK